MESLTEPEPKEKKNLGGMPAHCPLPISLCLSTLLVKKAMKRQCMYPSESPVWPGPFLHSHILPSSTVPVCIVLLISVYHAIIPLPSHISSSLTLYRPLASSISLLNLSISSRISSPAPLPLALPLPILSILSPPLSSSILALS